MRFVLILMLALWLGGIFFFGAIMAPTVFHSLPTHTLSGYVIFPTLTKLHYLGLACGLIFIAAGLWLRTKQPMSSPISPLILVALMMVLTCYAQFGLGAKMNGMRLGMGDIDAIPQTDARRVEFNRLHKYSTGLEESIFFLGLGALFLTSRRLS
jgi:Domain of unknown function (DUF4149)